jgi:uncharacterized protein YjbJ (UPF0337 family)
LSTHGKFTERVQFCTTRRCRRDVQASVFQTFARWHALRFCREHMVGAAYRRLGDTTMNWDQVKGDWMKFKGKVREQWGNLTDDQLDRIAGKRDQLAGEVQKAYGVTKEEAERQIKKFEARCDASEKQ